MFTRWIRAVYAVVAWLYVVGVVAQVFMAGLGVFAGPFNWQPHVRFGFALGLPLLLLLALAILGRVPRAVAVWLGALFLDYVIQGILPGLRDVSPYLASLHPVNALAIFFISLMHAWQARVFLRDIRKVSAAEPSALSNPIQASKA